MNTTVEAPLTDKDAILARIAAIEAGITSVDAHISDAELLLASLRLQRQARTDRANELRKLLTHVHKLPVETLVEIFRIYHVNRLLRHDCYGVLRRNRTYTNPWILRSICKLWSAVADDIPEFWSNVSLKYPSLDLEHAMTTQMRRNKARLPGTVDLTIKNNRMDELHCVPTTLVQFPGMIRSIVLEGIDPERYSDLFPDPIFRSGNLELEPLRDVYAQVGKAYSQLKKFCAHAGADDDGAERFGMFFQPRKNFLPWSQLTCIEVGHGMKLWTAHNLLKSCNSLVDCSIAITGPEQTHWEMGYENHPTTLRHLRNLQLEILSSLQYSRLFDAFTLPALKKLGIILPHLAVNDVSNDYDIDTSYMDLKRRSCLDLQEFWVEIAYGFTTTSLITFLKDMPSLASIRLNWTGSCIDEELMEALTVQPRATTPSRLAPNLTHFAFGLMDMHEISLSCIVDMLESRRPSSANAGGTQLFQPLRSADLNHGGQVEDDVWGHTDEMERRIEALREEGMKVVVRCN